MYERTPNLPVAQADTMTPEELAEHQVMVQFLIALPKVSQVVHTRNKKWWQDLHTGEPIKRNFGEICMLIVSEVSEAMEGDRKNLPDDKLPNRPMREVEFADALIRIIDAAAGYRMDLAGAFYEKMQFNLTREDHKIEARKLAGGKAY